MRIRKAGKSNAGSSVILAGKEIKLKTLGMDNQAMAYADEQLKAGKKIIHTFSKNTHTWICLEESSKTRALKLESRRLQAALVCNAANGLKIKSLTINNLQKDPEELLAFAEGMALNNYQFRKYREKTSNPANTLSELKLHGAGLEEVQCTQLETLVEAVYLGRNLVNEPLSYLSAVQFGKEVQEMGKKAGFKVEVFNKARIRSLKMGGLLAVNQGSIDPPVFVVMEHKPRGAVNKKPYVLVGKGVVYDTGGLSLKPTDGMATMKCDMAGAAAVASAMYAIAATKLPVWVVGLTPATDNRPDGNAIVPGDVIRISDGTTVEVLNTDAEGRLILSDALVYAQKYKPELVIDLATLTGAASRAIGRYGIVAMRTAGSDFDRLCESGDLVHERLVEFPLWDDYAELIKSDIADLKNIGGITAGANTAGKFLEHFTNYPWIHLDIAGPAFTESADSYRGKGGTGTGIRLLFNFIRNKAEI